MKLLPFDEQFLHFVWKNGYFSLNHLQTLKSENLQIIELGYHNTNAGPDFTQAKIRINNIEWNGNIEIHKNASDWYAHGHHTNPAYNTVVLHVVYSTTTKPTLRQDGSECPVFCIQNHIYKNILSNAHKLLGMKQPLYCKDLIDNVPSYVFTGATERALISRLERKAKDVVLLAENLKFDWDEVAYRTLCEYLGAKVNNEAFLRLAEITPYKYLLKCFGQATQIEALLLGQAGLLTANEHVAMYKEYQFLKAKFDLPHALNPVVWKYSRLRPQAFPEVAIGSLAKLLSTHQSLFHLFTQFYSVHDLLAKIDQSLPDTHKKASKLWVRNMVINTSALLATAYGIYTNDTLYIQKVLQWLETMPYEHNNVTKNFGKPQWPYESAFDSQGQIELYNTRCKLKKCMQCTLGAYIVAHS